MKLSLSYLLLGLLVLPLSSLASHILGGEIRYEHISGNRYRFEVNVFRDCGSCKLNGNGKGSSQENCDDIKLLYITTVGEQTTNLASIPLSRQSITDITPVCESVYNSCENSNGMIGIERHLFTGTYDFSGLLSDQQCEFDIHLQIASRSTALTNGMESEKFHNYARLNLCFSESNDAPQFLAEPIFHLQRDKTYRLSSKASDDNGDSLAYFLVAPMVDFNQEGQFNSGFNHRFPISSYCPMGGQCQAFPNLERPVGFDLNPELALLTFIPVRSSEVSVLCIEVREYRRVNDSYEEIGRIRRDVQLNVHQPTDNNPPAILNQASYDVKANEDFCLTIETEDLAHSTVTDTVSLSYHFNGGNHQFILTENDTAPFRHYTFCFKPEWKDTGQSFDLWLEANDGYCPIPLVSQKSISINVLPPQRAQILIEEKPCNLYQFSYESNLDVSEATWQVIDEHSKLLFEKRSHLDSFFFSEAGTYRILLQLDAGGGPDTFLYELVVDHSQQSVVSIDTRNELCFGDSLELVLLSNNGYRILSNRWYLNGKELHLNGMYSEPLKESGVLQVVSAIEKNGVFCSTSDTMHIKVFPLPSAHFSLADSFCEGEEPINLNDIPVDQAGGTWAHVPANNLQLNLLSFPPRQGQGLLSYEVTSADGCVARLDKPYHIVSGPQFSLNDLDICQNSGLLSLQGLIRQSTVSESTVQWDFGSVSPFVTEINGAGAIELDSLKSGRYPIIGVLIGGNGCKSRDTASIEIRDQLSISFDRSEIVICDTIASYDLEELTGVKPQGGVFISDDWRDELINNSIKAGSCGTRTLTYTYDQFGCFGSQTIDLNVICKPELDLDIPSELLCDGFDGIQLNARPEGGKWSGSVIDEDGLLSIPPLQEAQNVVMTYEISLSECSFSQAQEVLLYPSPRLNYHFSGFSFCEGDELQMEFSGQYAQALHIRSLSGAYDTSLELPGGDFPFELDLNMILDNSSTSTGEVFVINAEALADCPTENINVPLTIYPMPSISYSTEQFAGCTPYEMIFEPELLNYEEDQAIYQWDFDTDENKIRAERIHASYVYDLPGIYRPKLVITTMEGCVDTFEYVQGIQVYPTPTASFTSSPEVYTSVSEPIFQFQNQSTQGDSIRYLWDFGTHKATDQSQLDNPWFTYPSDTTRYTVRLTVTGEGGCTDYFEKELIVGPDIQLFIPNAFSPNRKGPAKNNIFRVEGQNVAEITINVYDRWGHKVFQTNRINDAWDGTSNGNLCTQGVYKYHINAMSKTGVQYEYAGTVHLLR